MAELKLDFVIKNINNLKKQFENIQVGKKDPSKSKAKDRKEGQKDSSNISKMAVGIGALVGFVGVIIGSLNSIVSFIAIITSAINRLVAPFVPILITLLKPVLIVLAALMQFMFTFFKDPAKAITDGFIGAKKFFEDLLGFGEEDDPGSQKKALQSTGVVGGALIGSKVGGVPGAIAGGAIGGLTGGALGDILNKPGISDVVKVFRDGLKLLLDDPSKFFSEFLDGLTSIFTILGLGVDILFTGFVDGLKSIFTTIVTTLKTAVTNFGNLFIDGLNKLIALLNAIPGVKVNKVKRFGDEEKEEKKDSSGRSFFDGFKISDIFTKGISGIIGKGIVNKLTDTTGTRAVPKMSNQFLGPRNPVQNTVNVNIEGNVESAETIRRLSQSVWLATKRAQALQGDF